MNKFGTLYIVATPIGNLEDITLRAISTLKQVSIIACEDTRVTKKLLLHYNIQKPLVSYHQHSRMQKVEYLLQELKKGKNIALVTDAGTPGISDPGNKLVSEVIKENINIVPIPGPSALGTLISIAGIDLQKFSFFGFPPHKKGRQTFFKEVVSQKYPVIYYDSSHRIQKNLELLESLQKDTQLIVGRELTKIFEEVIRGTVSEVLEYLRQDAVKQKGEFVVIVYGRYNKNI